MTNEALYINNQEYTIIGYSELSYAVGDDTIRKDISIPNDIDFTIYKILLSETEKQITSKVLIMPYAFAYHKTHPQNEKAFALDGNETIFELQYTKLLPWATKALWNTENYQREYIRLVFDKRFSDNKHLIFTSQCIVKQ